MANITSSPQWHHQRSLALAGLKQKESAEKAQVKAMLLAKEQGRRCGKFGK